MQTRGSQFLFVKLKAHRALRKYRRSRGLSATRETNLPGRRISARFIRGRDDREGGEDGSAPVIIILYTMRGLIASRDFRLGQYLERLAEDPHRSARPEARLTPSQVPRSQPRPRDIETTLIFISDLKKDMTERSSIMSEAVVAPFVLLLAVRSNREPPDGPCGVTTRVAGNRFVRFSYSI